MSPRKKRILGTLVSIHERGGFAFILARDSKIQYWAHVREVEPSAWAHDARVSFEPGEKVDPNRAPKAFKVRLALEGEGSR